jgi:hypothetical protein
VVDVLGVSPQQTVRCAEDFDVVSAWKQRVKRPPGDVDRQDPIMGSVDDQYTDVVAIDLGDVGPEVGWLKPQSDRSDEPGRPNSSATTSVSTPSCPDRY